MQELFFDDEEFELLKQLVIDKILKEKKKEEKKGSSFAGAILKNKELQKAFKIFLKMK
jgi:hypothetical protein